MKKRTRLLIGTAILSAAVLIAAWKGQFDYLSIAAAGLVFGIPEIMEVVKLYLSKNKCDHPDHQ